MGGVPAQLVPDNLKVGVDRANWYEPGLNRTYLDMAAHYGTAILPTRVRKPRDKAKVEVAVLVVERWILARCGIAASFRWPSSTKQSPGSSPTSMRDRCVAWASAAATCSSSLIARRSSRCRQQSTRRRVAPRRVSLDYHVDIDGHYYSVPYRLIRDQVEARLTARTVELFHKGERVAVHLRGVGRGRHTTLPEHMPSFAPAACRVDDRADRAHGSQDRPEHRPAHRHDPDQPTASRAGLSGLSRHPAPGAPVRRRAARGGLRSRARHRRPLLRLDPVDPQERPRSAAATPELAGRAGAARSPNLRGSPLLPLRRQPRADPSHARSAAAARARRHGQSLHRARGEPEQCRTLPCRMAGLLLDREATERYDRRLRARLRYARLRHQAVVEDVNYRAPRGLDRTLFQNLAGGRWVEEART